MLHTRLRRGGATTQYGVKRFFEETIARCHRAGYRGEFLVGAGTGFNYDLFRAIIRHGGSFSVATPLQPRLRAAVE